MSDPNTFHDSNDLDSLLDQLPDLELPVEDAETPDYASTHNHLNHSLNDDSMMDPFLPKDGISTEDAAQNHPVIPSEPELSDSNSDSIDPSKPAWDDSADHTTPANSSPANDSPAAPYRPAWDDSGDHDKPARDESDSRHGSMEPALHDSATEHSNPAKPAWDHSEDRSAPRWDDSISPSESARDETNAPAQPSWDTSDEPSLDDADEPASNENHAPNDHPASPADDHKPEHHKPHTDQKAEHDKPSADDHKPEHHKPHTDTDQKTEHDKPSADDRKPEQEKPSADDHKEPAERHEEHNKPPAEHEPPSKPANDGVHGNQQAWQDDWYWQGETMYCGPTSASFILNQFFGANIFDPNTLVKQGLDLGIDNSYEDGTTMPQLAQLLKANGVETTTENANTSDPMGDLATKLDEGRGVIAFVDAHEIWDQLHPEQAGQADHANNMPNHFLVVTEIDTNTGTVTLADPGLPDGNAVKVDLKTFQNAWQDSDYSMISTNGVSDELKDPNLQPKGGDYTIVNATGRDKV